MMLNQVRVVPMNSIVGANQGSGGVSTFSPNDRDKLNSLFRNIIATQNQQNKALGEQSALIANINAVISSRPSTVTDNDSSTLGGGSNSTSDAFNLIKGETKSHF